MNTTLSRLSLIVLPSAFFLLPLAAFAATNDLKSLLQQGLFEEEANRNLAAAISNYQSLATKFDQDRQVAATAVFRLGECYRKLGKTNEAVTQYERIVREFSDQQTLATLSRQNLAGLGTAPQSSTASAVSGESAEALARAAAAEAEAASLKVQLDSLLKLSPILQRDVLQQNFPNPVLTKLMQDQAEAEQKLVGLQKDYNPDHPSYVNQRKVIDKIDSQINEQVKAMILAMQTKYQATVETAKALRTQVGQPGSPQIAPSAAGAEGAAPSTEDEEQEIRRIQALLKGSPDLINAPGKNGVTLLQAAAGKGQFEVVQFLLDHGAAANGPQGQGLTALHYAAGNGHKAVVDLLIRHGANLGAETPSGVTPLHLAARIGYTQVAKALIDAGAPLNARILQGVDRKDNDPEYDFRSGDRPLTVAVANGFTGVAELLITAKADLEAADGSGNPPLIKAITTGQKGMAQFLLEHGAKVDARDGGKVSALHRAASSGRTELMELLLSFKADVNSKDSSEGTPLHYAAANSRKDAVELLLAHGAGVNARNKSGETPLYQAAQAKSSECIATLLAAKADPNLPATSDSHRDWTSLHWATANHDRLSAELLLKNGADPNARMATTYFPTSLSPSYYGREFQAADGTPLLIAAADDQTELVQLLLKYKADPNLASRTGWVPLQLEVLKINESAVADLLDHSANVNVAIPEGSTPLHLAVSVRSQKLIELLLARGADPNVLNRQGQTPLELAKYYATNSPLKMPPSPRTIPIPSVPGTVTLPISPASTEATPGSDLKGIADLLRTHGALDNLPHWDRIEVRRPSASFSETVFRKGTNDWNRFSLLELIAKQYGFVSDRLSGEAGAIANLVVWSHYSLPFPNFNQVVIHRPSLDGKKWTSISVDVSAILDSGDCSKDVILQWGDAVELPETDHPVSEIWRFPQQRTTSLIHCVSRTLKIVVQGTSTDFKPALEFEYWREGPNWRLGGSFRRISPSFMLRSVLDQSKLIRFSSDLTRVKVTRQDPAAGKKQQWVLNCSDKTPPDFWVRDGDVIEVPEK